MKKTFLASIIVLTTLIIKSTEDPDFNQLLQNIKDTYNLTDKEAQYFLQTSEGESLYYAFKTYKTLLTKNASCTKGNEEDSIIYAPWRDAYLAATAECDSTPTSDCPFCVEPHEDKKQFIIRRFKYNFIKLNAYPYSKGHILIIPYAHVKNLDDLSCEARHELIDLISASYNILKTELNIEGANIGINLERVSGASVPDHIHVQIVPRKKRPFGFIQTISKSRIVGWDLNKSYKKIKKAFKKLT